MRTTAEKIYCRGCGQLRGSSLPGDAHVDDFDLETYIDDTFVPECVLPLMGYAATIPGNTARWNKLVNDRTKLDVCLLERNAHLTVYVLRRGKWSHYFSDVFSILAMKSQLRLTEKLFQCAPIYTS